MLGTEVDAAPAIPTWIGYWHHPSDDKVVTTDGSKATYQLPFADGEPNSYQDGDYSCYVIARPGYIWDIDCYKYALPFICKVPRVGKEGQLLLENP